MWNSHSPKNPKNAISKSGNVALTNKKKGSRRMMKKVFDFLIEFQQMKSN